MFVRGEEYLDSYDGEAQPETLNVLSTEDGEWVVEWVLINPGGSYTHIDVTMRVPGELRDADEMRTAALRQAVAFLQAALTRPFVHRDEHEPSAGGD